MLLQMPLFHSFSWLNSTPLYISMPQSSLSIPLSRKTQVASVLATVKSAAVHIRVRVSF